MTSGTSTTSNILSLSAKRVAEIGSDLVTRGQKDVLDDRSFVAFYNRTPNKVKDIWDLCSDNIKPRPKLIHLFWALMYMKLYLPLDVMVVLCSCSKPTFEKWCWMWMEAIASKHVEIIVWDKRFRNAPKDVWCLTSVDGTDFLVDEPFPFNRKFKSPKVGGAGFKYEVALSIYSGDIVWIYGPHNGGKHDVTIARELLVGQLDEGEMIEGDRGYRGLVDCRAPDDALSEEEYKEKSNLRARHETVNHRLKTWGVLKQRFHGAKQKHQFCFYAIAVMTQMSIDSGRVLFSCEPKTKKKKTYYI